MPSPDSLLLADDEARVDALDVSRSFIVQAPAGSGKTELLIQRYLRLLAVVDSPEEILAITFTRKAAAEMQLRVLQALRRARRGETPSEEHEKVTARAARAVLRRDQELDWRLVEYPSRMRIQTLDALNASISRMRPLTGSAAIANTVAEDVEIRALYRDSAAATLDWLTEPGSMQGAVEEVLLHVDNNTDTYVAYLSRMLETRDQWLPFVGKGRLDGEEERRLRKQLEDNLQRVVTAHLESLRKTFPREILPELLPLLEYASKNLAVVDENIAAVPAFDSLPSSDQAEQWRTLAGLLLTRKGDWRRRVNKNQGFPPGDQGQKAVFHDLLETLSPDDTLRDKLGSVCMLPPVRYSDEQWSVLLALFQLLPVAVAELQRLFSSRRLIDYIEIAIGASEALGSAGDPGDVAMLLDHQVRHILIDEMQDTSRAQYRLVEALTGGWEQDDGRTLFCVGDPMQSIYRFRNAEVSQFLFARDAGIGNIQFESLLLRRNFRSGNYLVDWFNTVFPDVLPHGDDPARGAVTYSESVPGRNSPSDCRIYPVFGSDSREEADVACKVIQSRLAENDEDTMAVLVRSRTQLADLLALLRAAGVPYQSVDIDRLTDLPEVIELIALTRAIAHPGDRLAWLAILRSPWIGWSWRDLHSLVRNDTESTVWELLQSPERVEQLSNEALDAIATALPILESTQAAARSEPLRDRVERTWLKLGGPAMLNHPDDVEYVQKFLDVLGKLESAGTLPDVAELEKQLDLERVSGNSGARLQIMTMHKAKGLQFDHVLLFGLGRRPRSSTGSVLSWYDLPDSDAGEEKIISPVGRRDELDDDPIHRYIGLREREKDQHEAGRLLYVACTRARKTLHLVGHTGVSADGQSCRPPEARSLLRLLWPAIGHVYESAFVPDPPEKDSSADDEWWCPQRQRIEPAWTQPPAPKLPSPGADTPPRIEPVEFYWVGSGARTAGTIVHRWLQLAAVDPAALSQGGAAQRRVTNERWLLEAGIASDQSLPILERIEAALEGIIGDPRGEWLLSGPGHTELALTGRAGESIESGIIDRVKIDDDGSHWIVDYKTSTHEGGDLEGFLDAELERYRDQLTRYARLYEGFSGERPRCALYFPLLRAFRELRV